MGEPISINKNQDIKLDSFQRKFLNPKYVFIPVRKGNKLKVSDNSYVYKNDIILFDEHGKSIHSSISGKVLGVKDMLYINDEVIPSVVIENDFKENIRMRKSAKKYLSFYTKKAFEELLEDNSLYYKGKFIVDKFINEEDTLLINGVELEPYFGNNYFLLIENYNAILETIDLISDIYKFKKIILVMKNIDSEIIDKFINQMGTYPNIELRLVDDEYPLGLDRMLKRELKIDSCTTLSIEEIVWIYNVLKKQSPVCEKTITISGNAVKPRSAISVKIGSLLSEVFTNNFDFTEAMVDVYLNGMMHGKLVNTLKYVITSDIDGIIVNKKLPKNTEKCMNCGMCARHCPEGLNPKYMKEHPELKEKYKDKCLKCGLCNYVCPSNIDLRKMMEED